ncbi:MAG: DUF6089 family protein [bacterium]|nr:DUF6089 family protein [bacterium]
MRFLLVFLLLNCAFLLKSQWRWDYGATLGFSNYLGDIGGKEKTRRDFAADMKLAKTRWNVGGFIRHRWKPKLSWKFAVDYLRIEGDDHLSTNAGRYYRNFNFRNDIYDLAYTFEYFFYTNNDIGNNQRFQNQFRAYAFIGGGAFYSNPKSYYRGEYVSLQPHATEGVIYHKWNMNIPMGAGFYFTVNRRNRLGFEINYRKTFTDYLDDISGNYPATPPGSEYEQGLVLRTTELNREDNPGAYDSHTWGMKRGDSKHKDAYATMSFSYSRVIRGRATFYRPGGGFFNKKRKGRKIRAKF